MILSGCIGRYAKYQFLVDKHPDQVRWYKDGCSMGYGEAINHSAKTGVVLGSHDSPY